MRGGWAVFLPWPSAIWIRSIVESWIHSRETTSRSRCWYILLADAKFHRDQIQAHNMNRRMGLFFRLNCDVPRSDARAISTFRSESVLGCRFMLAGMTKHAQAIDGEPSLVLGVSSDTVYPALQTMRLPGSPTTMPCHATSPHLGVQHDLGVPLPCPPPSWTCRACNTHLLLLFVVCWRIHPEVAYLYMLHDRSYFSWMPATPGFNPDLGSPCPWHPCPTCCMVAMAMATATATATVGPPCWHPPAGGCRSQPARHRRGARARAGARNSNAGYGGPTPCTERRARRGRRGGSGSIRWRSRRSGNNVR